MTYGAGTANGAAIPIVETTNQLTNPDGGCPLQVGEGKWEKNDWCLLRVIDKGKKKKKKKKKRQREREREG